MDARIPHFILCGFPGTQRAAYGCFSSASSTALALTNSLSDGLAGFGDEVGGGGLLALLSKDVASFGGSSLFVFASGMVQVCLEVGAQQPGVLL